jgi:hypothetical protein
MRRGPTALALAAAALATLGTAGGAAASTEVATAVSGFSWTDADGATDHFDGQISSDAKKCVRQRRVSLYRKASGPDLRLATAKTDKSGEFTVAHEDPGSGSYYLKVKRAEVGATACKRTEAGPLQVTDLAGV